MAEFGFTSADIASMTQARQGLVAGFMQLGKQIQEDITRIATVREMKSFGQELANLDPTQDDFPNRLVSTMSKYPLATKTPLARSGIEMLGVRYRASQQAKKTVSGATNWVDLGGGLYHVRGSGTFRYNEDTGQPEFVDVTPNPPNYRTVTTAEGIMRLNPQTGQIEGKIGDLPPSRSAAGMGALSQNLRQSNDTIRAYRTERQKLIDQLKTGEVEGAAALPYLKADDPRLLRIKEIESAIEKETQNARDLTNRAYGQPTSLTPAMPTGAGQGLGGPSLMPVGSVSSFVPMTPGGAAPPGTVPTPAQMTINEPNGAVLPDQLPILPVVGPSIKQLSGPRLYQTREGGKIAFPRANYRDAVEQAYNDQVITEDRRNQLLANP